MSDDESVKTKTPEEIRIEREGELLARSVLAVADGHCRESGPHVQTPILETIGENTAIACFLFLRDVTASMDPASYELYVLAFFQSVAATIGKIGLRASSGRIIPIAARVAESTVKVYDRIPARVAHLDATYSNVPSVRAASVPVAPPEPVVQDHGVSSRTEAMLKQLGV